MSSKGVLGKPGYDIGEEGYPDQEEEEKFMDRGHPILVRTLPSEKNLSLKLMRYFGSNSKSGGGECEVTRVDGQTYCAVFQNQDDPRRVLGRGNHVIEVTVPVTVHDIGREDLARIRQLSGDEERLKMLHRLAVRIPRISRSASSVEKMDTGRSSAMDTDRSSAMDTGRSSAMYTDRSSAMDTGRSSAMDTDRSSANTQKVEEPDLCPICLCEPEDKVILEKCKHAYCKECLRRATAKKPVCAICGDAYGTVTGDQPDGTMSVHTSKYQHLPGYPGCGIIEITYDIPSGTQQVSADLRGNDRLLLRDRDGFHRVLEILHFIHSE
ncbi:E3 ubiquitin-protein ligase DTX3L-like [Rana temporaria]|uniref:E3 ubiquitin-protein ligase DTX3L-like n=1 Tax=Rana temporaria TaxID=8407 RepID=UPI001AAD9BA8|nr:E3 ubiquitin-protein ligase DTX3L-like [Rana temporaria]